MSILCVLRLVFTVYFWGKKKLAKRYRHFKLQVTSIYKNELYTKNLTAKLQTQIKILSFPGLAQSGSEQPGPVATLLDWPKSIY